MQEIVIGKDRVSVGGMIGKGGEGKVYEITGRSRRAVKIYDAGLRAKREDKVRAMAAEGLAARTDLVAYPDEIVTDRQGNFLGFAMRRVSGYRPLHELYNPKSRLRHFPEADYRFLVLAAQNVARAVGNVHQTGCVIGDLNHSGVLVAQNATVALVDADSFQFSLNGKFYPCGVGVPDFTPPELQGTNLATAKRTKNHDNFGLAVAIFHLLFMGCHPYVGRYNGPDTTIGETISQNRFAFSLSRKSETKTSPPRGTLTLEAFPDAIIDSFEAAFGRMPKARPSAKDWIDALGKLARSLNRCSTFIAHHYPSTASDCVWCKLAGKNRFDMFPNAPTTAPNIRADTLGVEQVIQEIEAFHFPSAADILPLKPAPFGASNAFRKAMEDKRRRRLQSFPIIVGSALAVVGVSLIVIGAYVALLGVAYVTLIGIVCVLTGLFLARKGWVDSSDIQINTNQFLQAFRDADKQVQRELNELVRRNGLAENLKAYGDLHAAITVYKNFDHALNHELKVLKSNREYRCQAYLDQFLIENAEIPGIRQIESQTLKLHGIESAADVNWSIIINIPSIGEHRTSTLLDWRYMYESKFKYDPAQNNRDAADELTLRGEFANLKAKLISTILNGPSILRRACFRFDALSARARNDLLLNRALDERAQAARDLELLGVSVPASTVAITLQSPTSSIAQYPNAPRFAMQKRARTSKTPIVPSCPRCAAPMVWRTARRGRYRGKQFWGCSRFPKCRGICS